MLFRSKNVLGQYLSENGKTQLRIAETEKYAHVTFFFNGGVEAPYEGEDRCVIPSPKVATYDLKPEMSAPEVADECVKRIESGKYDVVILNFANCDMVGHTGVFEAAVKAVEAVDAAVEKVVTAVLNAGALWAGYFLCASGAGDSGLCPGMHGHKGGSRDFRPPPLRKGRRADYPPPAFPPRSAACRPSPPARSSFPPPWGPPGPPASASGRAPPLRRQ